MSSPAAPRTARSRRPRRSVADRRIAGVAGGLGRALGVDPLLVRVAFVALTVFGGSGGLLYLLGWLLLPGDGDEVSAAEALLGRGRSSVSPALATVLAVLVGVGAVSTVFWGGHVLPLLVIALVVVGWARHRSSPRPSGRRGPVGSPGSWERHAARLADRAERFGADTRAWARRWDTPHAGDRRTGSWAGRVWTVEVPGRTRPEGTRTAAAPAPPGGVSFVKSPPGDRAGSPADPGAGTAFGRPAPSPGSEEDALRITPPAWDPLGAAPFAWHLPEPAPVADPVGPRRDGRVLARVTRGLAVLLAGGAAVAVVAGWWSLSWAQVAAVALTTLAAGLLVSALTGRGSALVRPAALVALLTLGLTATGLRGTTGYGSWTRTVTDVSDLAAVYQVQAGDASLDLSGLVVPAGVTTSTALHLSAGHAQVVLPAGTDVQVTCTAGLGQVDCVGDHAEGMRDTAHYSSGPFPGRGTLQLTVDVRAGAADVVAS